MKIAIIDNIEHPVSNQSGFGVEVFTHSLITGLLEKGHQVTLYGSGDSEVPCPIISVNPIGTALDSSIQPEFKTYYQDWIFVKLYQHIVADPTKYDLVHSQDHIRATMLSSVVPIPVVSTYHDLWSSERTPIELVEKVSKEAKNTAFVAISEYQQQMMRTCISEVFMVHHGIDSRTVVPNLGNTSDQMLFIGRTSPTKGTMHALTTAQMVDKPLQIIGFTHHAFEETYKDQVLERIFQIKTPKITYLDSIMDVGKKFDYYKQSKLMLFPVQWEEPFGLVMIESMAAGTPVVAFARGSTPELIRDGVTGFLVNPSDQDKRGDFIIKKNGVEGLTEAAQRVYSLSSEDYIKMREACRKHIEENFSIEKMISSYEGVYQILIDRARNPKG